MPSKTSSDATITRIYGKTKGKIQTQSKIPPIDFHAKTGLAVEYTIDGNMTQASIQEYSITDIPPIDFMSDGNGISAYSIYGNMTQASSQEYSLSGTSPLSFISDTTTLDTWNVNGNMVQAASQEYTISGTSPITFQSDAMNIAYNIEGQMTQTGTPTPSLPITPEETGDKTGNLCSVNAWKNTQSTDTRSFLQFSIILYNGDTNIGNRYLNVQTVGTFSLTTNATDNMITKIRIKHNGSSRDLKIAEITGNWSAGTVFTASANCIGFDPTTLNGIDLQDIMLNTGSTALPYEPYGYKIPITTNGTTQTAYITEPIRKIGDYADSVNSDGTVTRYVKKLVLTGEETILTNVGGQAPFQLKLTDIVQISNKSETPFMCSHYQAVPNNAAWSTYISMITWSFTSGETPVSVDALRFRDTSFGADLDAFKSYLAAQYAAGTPVTVWYVLETPTTETFTAPTITAISGSNTLTVDTTLPPSNISITTNSSVYPLNPIYPIECGERTGNLFDETVAVIGILDNDGTVASNGAYKTSDYCKINTNFTLSLIARYATGRVIYVAYYTADKQFLSKVDKTFSGKGYREYSYSIPEGTEYIRFSYLGRESDGDENIMLNSGSTALPYEPYGYKIPLTCASQTVPVYLGQTQTVRRVKKLVFDGTESWIANGSGENTFRGQLVLEKNNINSMPGYCTHLKFVTSGLSTDQECIGCFNGSVFMRISRNIANDLTAFKSYLAAQYAAGTPVTVWYILAELTTGIVNEPLCKIGDYADELNSTDAAVTIPTISGDNTLSIGTTLQPSSVSITTSSGVWPNNPIIPEEGGDKTEQMIVFPYYSSTGTYSGVDFTVSPDGRVTALGTTTGGANFYFCRSIELQAGTYTISLTGTHTGMALFVYDADAQSVIANIGASSSSSTFTITETRSNIHIYFNTGQVSAINIDCYPMLNSGNEPLPYEPYGKYKLPITLAGTTQTIYLNEPIRKIGNYSDSIGEDGIVTRNIKKLVLDGTEISWASGTTYYTISISPNLGKSLEKAICSHAPYETGVAVNSDGTVLYFRKSDFSDYSDLTAFKAFLAAQYANGNPVTVWYVLEIPTTETITSPTISTALGTNTLSIGTTLQPSNVSLTTTSSVYPLNPIIPEEVGERTGNLFDASNTTFTIGNTLTVISNGDTISFTGTTQEITSSNAKWKELDFWLDAGEYTLSLGIDRSYQSGYSAYLQKYDDSTRLATISGSGASTVSGIILTERTHLYVAFYIYNKTLTDDKWVFMLNTGSTAQTYEPYGYKIPLNLNNTISNIYLSQPIRKIGNYSDSINADNTVSRYIKKLVLTGQESWSLYGSGKHFQITLDNQAAENGTFIPISNAFNGIQVAVWDDIQDWDFSFSPSQRNNVRFRYDVYEDNLSGWKNYLKDQYAAGTPVTVWYVLATPEVEQITTPTITPQIESNNLSINTTLQPSNLSITYTSPDYSEIKLAYDNQENILYNDPPYHDWGAVRWIVRQGLGPQYYPIGYIFYDNFNPLTGTAFQVVAHNKHFDPNLIAAGYTYSMTLCEVLLTDVITFDAAEAFLYTEVDIPAGTYKFTIPDYDATYGGNKTYYFTSTATLPSGSQIIMSWPYQQTPKTVTGYVGPNPQTNTTALSGFSALTLTEWVDGTSPEATDLGTIAGPTTQLGTSNYGQMNHIHRARYGSNNYLQSGIRQYINSNSSANAWWTPQTVFDRPYGSRSSAGRLTKLNQDLVSVMATPEIKSRTNSYFETTSLDGTTFTLSTDYTINTDKMFLLSPMEVNFNTTDTTIGTTLDYYVDATNETRIKKRKSNNTAYYWWLRTPYPTTARNVRIVNTSGALDYYTATSSYGAASVCVIQ